MSKLTRFGVSVDSVLLEKFDDLIGRSGYRNRSEAFRDLIRDRLVAEEWTDSDKETVGILGLVYSHEARDLTETLNAIQHEYVDMIISATHIHLDAHNCLEVIIMRGKSGNIQKVSDRLLSTRNVKHGRLLTTTTGAGLD